MCTENATKIGRNILYFQYLFLVNVLAKRSLKELYEQLNASKKE